MFSQVSILTANDVVHDSAFRTTGSLKEGGRLKEGG